MISVQLNKCETEPYFLQFFQSNTTVCLIIHVFCESCDPEIVLNSDPNYYAQCTKALDWCSTQNSIQNKNNFMVTNLTKCVNQHCLGLEISKKNGSVS